MDLTVPINFLIQLALNNNKAWFNQNRELYESARKEFNLFVDTLIPIIKTIDPEIDVFSARECTFRIFKDARFSKGGPPYKTNFGAHIAKGGRKSVYAGFYVHMEPNGSFVGGGIYMPEAKYLKAIRTRIYQNAQEYKSIISGVAFKKYFSEIYGEKLKNAPRDFPKDFEDIDLLKNKHYVVTYSINDSLWTSKSLIEELTTIFKAQLPFNEFLNNAIKKAIAKEGMVQL